MTTNNSVGKEEIKSWLINYCDGSFPGDFTVNEVVEIIKQWQQQPLSPQSAEGVEEKKVDKNSMRLILKKHQVLEVIDDSFVHGAFPIEFIIAAMTEYSSLMNKEKDREIDGLNNVISKLFADKVSETRELQQLLSEKEKEMGELKERCIYWAKVYDENKKEIESLKQQKP